MPRVRTALMGMALLVGFTAAASAFEMQQFDYNSVMVRDGVSFRYAIHVKGETQSNGVFMLGIETGAVVTRAMRVYSEPSHALLATVIDRAFSESLEGRAWLETTQAAKAQAVATVNLANGSKPRLQALGRPSNDSRIVVWVYGITPTTDGGLMESDRLYADAGVGGGDFEFSSLSPVNRTAVMLERSKASRGFVRASSKYVQACQGCGTEPMCCGLCADPCGTTANCTSFVCCLVSTAECPHCGHQEIHCGAYECYTCNP